MESVPDASFIHSVLVRILASPYFTPRLKAFLKYVTEETLDGKGEAIKGYSIGTLVFGRPDDFDPTIDSIVRVEAVRLRAALSRYYEGDGRDDPVIISIPAGGYAPRFAFRDAGHAAMPPSADKRAVQDRKGGITTFRTVIARLHEQIASVEAEISVSRTYVSKAGSLVGRARVGSSDPSVKSGQDSGGA